MQVSAVRWSAALAALLFLAILPGCGGGTPAAAPVASISLTPTTVSLNEGAVTQLSAIAMDSNGSVVAADITFTSSNAGIATVSTGGLVCGGSWDSDSTPVNCNVTGGVGQVTVTATATTNTQVTATVTVYVHERVDRVEAVLVGSCTTMGNPINISGEAFSTSAPGCSPSSPCNITSTVGPFSFGSNDTTIAFNSSGINSTYSTLTNTPVYVSGGTIKGSSGQTCNLSDFNGVNGATGTVALTSGNTIASGTHLTITDPGTGGTVAPTTATLTNGTASCSGTATVSTSLSAGVMTAGVPGATSLYASVAGVNSVGVSYLTCPVHSIAVHAPNGSQTSFTINPTGTQTLTADVFDTNNQLIVPTITWGSSSLAAATVAPLSGGNLATVTGVAGGTAYITATCSSPDCNKNLPAQFSQNVATINVTQPITTTVYAASTNSTMLVPINTGNNTPGTAITLPVTPNSIVASPSGATVYLGSASQLMSVTVSSGAVTTSAVGGTILAISPDGNYLLMSDDVNNVIQYVNASTGAILNSKSGTTAYSSAYTPDAKYNQWVNATELGVGSSSSFSYAIPLSYTPGAQDIIAEGGLTYITSGTGGQVYVYATCNQSLQQTLTGTNPSLVRAIPNGTGAVVADSPNLDVVSTPMPLSAGCPATTQSTINSYNPGVGSFTAQQLLISPDSSNAWLITNLPNIVSFNLTSLTPSIVLITNGATAFNGGLTSDSQHLWVGASDNLVHRIDLSTRSDNAQVNPNLKDTNGNTTAPNLVAVVP